MKLFYKPDKHWNIADLSGSILKHYHIPIRNPGYPPVDELLTSAPRNIVLLLLDGLGQNILTRHHQADVLSSVFPPTTTVA